MKSIAPNTADVCGSRKWPDNASSCTDGQNSAHEESQDIRTLLLLRNTLHHPEIVSEGSGSVYSRRLSTLHLCLQPRWVAVITCGSPSGRPPCPAEQHADTEREQRKYVDGKWHRGREHHDRDEAEERGAAKPAKGWVSVKPLRPVVTTTRGCCETTPAPLCRRLLTGTTQHENDHDEQGDHAFGPLLPRAAADERFGEPVGEQVSHPAPEGLFRGGLVCHRVCRVVGGRGCCCRGTRGWMERLD